LPRSAHHPLPRAGGKMYVKCPACSTLMNRKLFATGAGVVVDICKAHGTFFDIGELPAILEFVQRGGLALAARKDAERAKQNERDRKFADALRANLPKPSSEVVSDRGTALVDLLVALFVR